MHHSVFQFCKFSAVPARCGTYEVTCDTLQLVYLGALAVRALLKILIRILETTVHATVTVMVH